ncbi:MAG: membrane dipeptidase [Gammaproteobacteria bacterium]|nr:membrane dipeptidase [Gammaproteobacteria bacterium]
MKIALQRSRKKLIFRLRLAPSLLLLTLYACTSPPVDSQLNAAELAQRLLIVDTHIDVPYRLHRKPADVANATDHGDFDYVRASTGGLNAPFMSIYIPATIDEAGEAFEFAEAAIDSVYDLAATHPDKFAVATCAADIEQQFNRGVISLPMGMENGGPIEGRVSNLEHFYARGIRYVTLAHGKSNHISDSSYDTNEPWQGLSPFGRELIPHMNRLGIMVDVSHISDRAFWQVIELSKTPVLASHSSLRHFVPGFHRNMSDEMVIALAARGGVVQINFGSTFVSKVARDYATSRTVALNEYRLAHQLERQDPSLMAFMQAYTATNPFPYATLNTVLDHIDRVVELAGIDHVGIGSDYDGVGDSLPVGLKDVASYPNLIAGLMSRGYKQPDIARILGENTLRVWRANEAYAASQATELMCID